MPDDNSLHINQAIFGPLLREGADSAGALAAARAEADRLRQELAAAQTQIKSLRTQLFRSWDTIDALNDEIYELYDLVEGA